MRRRSSCAGRRSGEAVRDLQRRLGALGYGHAPDEPGIFGAAHRAGGPRLPGGARPAGRRRLRPPDLGVARRERVRASATACSTSAAPCCGATTSPSCSAASTRSASTPAGRTASSAPTPPGPRRVPAQHRASPADGICGREHHRRASTRGPARRRLRGRRPRARGAPPRPRRLRAGGSSSPSRPGSRCSATPSCRGLGGAGAVAVLDVAGPTTDRSRPGPNRYARRPLPAVCAPATTRLSLPATSRPRRSARRPGWWPTRRSATPRAGARARPSRSRGRAYAVLRETTMAAVVCEPWPRRRRRGGARLVGTRATGARRSSCGVRRGVRATEARQPDPLLRRSSQ